MRFSLSRSYNFVNSHRETINPHSTICHTFSYGFAGDGSSSRAHDSRSKIGWILKIGAISESSYLVYSERDFINYTFSFLTSVWVCVWMSVFPVFLRLLSFFDWLKCYISFLFKNRVYFRPYKPVALVFVWGMLVFKTSFIFCCGHNLESLFCPGSRHFHGPDSPDVGVRFFSYISQNCVRIAILLKKR